MLAGEGQVLALIGKPSEVADALVRLGLIGSHGSVQPFQQHEPQQTSQTWPQPHTDTQSWYHTQEGSERQEA